MTAELTVVAGLNQLMVKDSEILHCLSSQKLLVQLYVMSFPLLYQVDSLIIDFQSNRRKSSL